MKKDFGFIFWVHLFLILLVWISPVSLSWKIILFFILLYYAQLFVFGDCILSKKQFGSKKREETFYSYYLEKLGINVNKARLVIFLDYVLPWVLLIVAYVIQKKGLVPILF